MFFKKAKIRLATFFEKLKRKKRNKANELPDLFVEYAETYKTETLNDAKLLQNAEISNLVKTHQDSMLIHSQRYTVLLGNYIYNSYYTMKQKRLFKMCFFWTALLSLLLSVVMFFVILILVIVGSGDSPNSEGLAALIASFVSMLSLYLIIPRIIAEYLFNIKEDENMTKVVRSIQKYDAEVDKHTFSTKSTDEKSSDSKDGVA